MHSGLDGCCSLPQVFTPVLQPGCVTLWVGSDGIHASFLFAPTLFAPGIRSVWGSHRHISPAALVFPASGTMAVLTLRSVGGLSLPHFVQTMSAIQFQR
jgi:hypothetical protein